MHRVLSVLMLIGLVVIGGPAAAQAPQRLEPGKPVERSLAGRESHTYLISLPARHVLSLVVDQRGVDVVVRVLSPQGKQIAEVDGSTGDQGPEPVKVVALVAGEYRAVLTPLEPKAPGGRYEIRLDALRKATRREVANVEAEGEIARLEEEYHQAHARFDVDAIRRLIAADYTLFPPSNQLSPLDRSGRIELLEGQKKQAAAAGASERRLRVERLIFRADGDMVSSWGHWVMETSRPGGTLRTPRHFLHVWRKRDGRWWLTVEQSFRADPIPQPRAATRIAPAIQAAYAGRYRNLSSGNLITVSDGGDHLSYQSNSGVSPRPLVLRPYTDTDFFLEGADFELTFVRDPAGRVANAVLIIGGIASRLERLP